MLRRKIKDTLQKLFATFGVSFFSGSFDDELFSRDPLFRSFAEVGKNLGAVRKDSVLQSF